MVSWTELKSNLNISFAAHSRTAMRTRETYLVIAETQLTIAKRK